MSFIADVVTRTAKRFQITEAEARKMVAEVLDSEIASQARTYVAKVEMNEEPIARLLAFRSDLAASAPPEMPKAVKAK